MIGGSLRTNDVFPYDQVSRSTYALTDVPGAGSTWILQSQEIVQQTGTITENRIESALDRMPDLVSEPGCARLDCRLRND